MISVIYARDFSSLACQINDKCFLLLTAYRLQITVMYPVHVHVCVWYYYVLWLASIRAAGGAGAADATAASVAHAKKEESFMARHREGEAPRRKWAALTHTAKQQHSKSSTRSELTSSIPPPWDESLRFPTGTLSTCSLV